MPHVMFGGLVHEPARSGSPPGSRAMLPGDLDRVFFSDSGSVSVEVAIKIAVQYFLNRWRVAGRTRLLRLRAAVITATPS